MSGTPCSLVLRDAADLVVAGLDDLLGSVPAPRSSRATCDVLIVGTTGRGATSRR